VFIQNHLAPPTFALPSSLCFSFFSVADDTIELFTSQCFHLEPIRLGQRGKLDDFKTIRSSAWGSWTGFSDLFRIDTFLPSSKDSWAGGKHHYLFLIEGVPFQHTNHSSVESVPKATSKFLPKKKVRAERWTFWAKLNLTSPSSFLELSSFQKTKQNKTNDNQQRAKKTCGDTWTLLSCSCFSFWSAWMDAQSPWAHCNKSKWPRSHSGCFFFSFVKILLSKSHWNQLNKDHCEASCSRFSEESSGYLASWFLFFSFLFL